MIIKKERSMKKMNVLSAILFSTALFVFTTALAAPVHYEAGKDGKATFLALGRPGLLKVRGEGASVVGDFVFDGKTVAGEFAVTLNEFDTGIGLRNEHMKENYLQTNQFPKAIVAIHEVNLPNEWMPGANLTGVAFKGSMTLKGVTKPIQGKVSVMGSNLKTDAEFSFSLSDYPIGVPSYMGITVAEQVQVNVSIPSFKLK